MQKNIGKILIFFIISIFGIGKIYINNINSNSNKNNKKENTITQKVENKKENGKNKKEGNTQYKTASGNRKYNIDYDHVIGGDENSSGKVTGGHTTLYGDVKVVKKIGNPSKSGVYKANVEIKKKNGSWQKKTSNGGVNTMFPEDWDTNRVIDEINSAWENRKDYNGKDSNMWQGRSTSGVLIRGYKKPRITAYPVYEERN